MKKFKLLSLLVLPAVILPVAFSVTSCSSLTKGIKELNLDSVGKKYFDDLKSPSPSLHSLLWGGKGFNKGNYVLFVTHSWYDAGIDFLLNTNVFLDGTDPQIYSKPQSTDDNLYDALKLQKEDYDTLSANYQFVSLIEKDTSETFTKGGEREPKLQPCTPFDKYDAKDEEANSKHKKDSYVRNDKQAKEYRDLLKLLNTLFDVPNTNDFTAVQWVKGYPVKASISSSVWQSNENFCNWIVANDEAGEGWK